MCAHTPQDPDEHRHKTTREEENGALMPLLMTRGASSRKRRAMPAAEGVEDGYANGLGATGLQAQGLGSYRRKVSIKQSSPEMRKPTSSKAGNTKGS